MGLDRTPPRTTRDRSNSLVTAAEKRKRSASLTREGRNTKGKPILCPRCNKDFVVKEDAVECECCSRWFHYNCEGLTKKEFDAVILLKKKSHWYCNDCSAGAALLYEDSSRLRRKQAKLEEELKVMKQKQSEADKNCEDIKQSVQTAEENIKAIDIKVENLKRDRSQDKNELDKITQDNQTSKTNIASNAEKIKKLSEEHGKTQEDVNALTEKVKKLETLESSVETKILTKVGEWVNKSIDDKKLDLKLVEIVKGTVDDTLKEYKDDSGKVSIADVVKKCVNEQFQTLKETEKVQIKYVDEQIKVVDGKISALKDDYPALPKPNDEFDVNYSEDRLMAAVVEREEIRKRKLQLVISHLKEKPNKEDDKRQVQELFGLMSPNKEIKITDMVRLGKPQTQPDKHRMIKVTVETLEMKRELLAKATRLRQVPENSVFHKVYVKPNLTKNQLEKSKNLQDQLVKVREKYPNQKFKISMGQIKEVPNPQ